MEIERHILTSRKINWHELKRTAWIDPPTRLNYLQTLQKWNGLEGSKLVEVVASIIRHLKVDLGIDITGRERTYQDALYSAAARFIPFEFLHDFIRPSSLRDSFPLTDDQIFEPVALLAHCLVAAAAADDIDTMTTLLDRGAKFDTTSKLFGEASYAAASAGSLNTFKLLVERSTTATKGIDFVSPHWDSRGRIYLTPLEEAVAAGKNNIVAYILKSMSHRLSNYGWDRVLSAASSAGNLPTLELLLNSDTHGKLSTRFDLQEALRKACHHGRLEVVKYMLDRCPNADFADLQRSNFLLAGTTALTAAAQGGHNPTIRYLLERGATLDQRDGHRGQELRLALQGSHFHTIQLLLDEAGADVDNSSDEGTEPLYIALKHGNIAMARYLIARGARVDWNDCAGRALTYAAFHGLEDVVDFIGGLEAVDIDYSADGGITAMYMALRSGHFRVARLLLKFGADPSSRKPPSGGWWNGLAAQFPRDECGCKVSFDGLELHPSHQQGFEEGGWDEFGMRRPWEGPVPPADLLMRSSCPSAR